MKIRTVLIVTFLLTLTACSFTSTKEGTRMRTVEENNAITDSWYPIQSKECQLLVDSFGLVQAAIGSNDTQYLLDNMDGIKRNLELTGQIVSQKMLELSQTTQEPSIREYALEAIPFYAQLGNLVSDSSSEISFNTEYLNQMYELTGKVPDACKS